MDAVVATASNRHDIAAQTPIRIGAITIDPVSREARYGDAVERIQPQNLKVLAALIECEGQVVTRDQLTDLCWNGRFVGDDVLNRAISTLRRFGQRSASFEIETVPRSGYRLRECSSGTAPDARSKWAAFVAIALAAAAGVAFYAPSGNAVPAVAVESAVGDARSAEAARAVAVRLGRLAGTNAADFRILGSTTSDSPDLLLSVEASSGQHGPQDVSLLTADRRTMLWAAHLDSAASKPVDDGLALAAATALACAAEGLGGPAKLPRETLGAYLTGCTRLSGAFDETSGDLAPMFESIVAEAPRFAPAWDKLLFAEALAAGWELDPRLFAKLRRHLQASRALKIDVPSAAIAEAALLPPPSYAERIEALEHGLRRHPRSAALRLVHGQYLMEVGRQSAAVLEATRAQELNETSPWVRGEYIRILANSGRLEEARRQLHVAQAIWPEAPDIRSVAVSLEIRYGDPSSGLELIKRGAARGGSAALIAFARARLDPTAANIDEAIRRGERAYRQAPEALSVVLQPQAQFGRTDDAIRTLLNADVARTTAVGTEALFRPMMHELWRDRRFMRAMARLGLASYWQRSGAWPDFCFDPQLPYDCRAEAARQLREAA